MAATTENSAQSRFLLTPEMMSGAIYRKYEKATRKFWDPKELDYSQDAADWKRMTEDQRNGILTITVRIEAGEEAVTDELLPMLSASHELGRFDWVMFLSTFMLDEARHSEFFNIWHREVAGITTAAEKAAHWPLRDHTVDPSGRFQVGEPVYEGIPKYGDALMAAVQSRDHEAIEAGFVRFSTLYNAWVEGVLTMPTYEIVMDTTAAWGVLPTLQAGLQGHPRRRRSPHHLRDGVLPDPDRGEPGLRGARPRDHRRVPRQCRRHARVPAQRSRARPRQVPAPEGAPLPRTAAARWGSPRTRRSSTRSSIRRSTSSPASRRAK